MTKGFMNRYIFLDQYALSPDSEGAHAARTCTLGHETFRVMVKTKLISAVLARDAGNPSVIYSLVDVRRVGTLKVAQTPEEVYNRIWGDPQQGTDTEEAQA